MTELKINLESNEDAVIIMLILEELRAAKVAHPIWPKDNVKRIAIVMEEAGEAVREANLLDEGKGSVQNLKVELRQTAAMCIRALQELQ